MENEDVTDPENTAITLLEGFEKEGAVKTAQDLGPRDIEAQEHSPENWTEGLARPERQGRLEKVRDTAEQAITKLAEALEQGRSEVLTEYLGTMARFHRYSFQNGLLILSQRPDATLVAGFRKWLELDRHVMKGEKGIAIMAPMVRKARHDTSPEEGEQSSEQGTDARVLRGFRVVYVFDVKQTEGKPLPEFSTVAGDPGEHLERLKQFTASQGIELEYAPDLGGADGLSSGGRIRLLEGQTPAHEFSVLAHEVAHELLHWTDRENAGDKRTRETEAEAVAYVVTSACGLQTGTAAKDYIQLYRGDRDTLAKSLERIQGASSRILAAVLPDE